MSSPFIPLAEAKELDGPLPQGWDAATEYHRLKKILPDGPLRRRAQNEAVRAVLDKAMECIRHSSHPQGEEKASWPQMPEGDLDLDVSLEEGLALDPKNPDRIRVVSRKPRRADIVLILDMSWSMTGEMIALIAVAVAVLALKLHRDDLGIVVFDTKAHVLKRLKEHVRAETIIRRVLEVPAQGFTNLEAGLKLGLKVLGDAEHPKRNAVLMSDGHYNVGWNPLPLAPRFPRLHVIQLGEGDAEAMDRGLSRRLASAGRGRYYRAEHYEDLPRMAHRLVQDLFR